MLACRGSAPRPPDRSAQVRTARSSTAQSACTVRSCARPQLVRRGRGPESASPAPTPSSPRWTRSPPATTAPSRWASPASPIAPSRTHPAFIFHTPTEICRGHHPFPEDVLNQYGFAIAEQHFTRARMPIVGAHCTLQLVSGPRTTPTVFVVDWPRDRTGARWCRTRRRRRLARVAIADPQLGSNEFGRLEHTTPLCVIRRCRLPTERNSTADT